LAPAIFGITNDGVNLAVNLVILSLVVIWLASIYWTYVDARRRMEDPVLIGCAVVASLFPFIGAVVYSIVRPAEYLEDVHERELETRAGELRMRELEEQTCPSCQHHIQPSYLRCPECGHHLKHACSSCARPVAPAWRFCPYCESSLTAPAPPKPSRGARRTAAPKAPRKKSSRPAEARPAESVPTQAMDAPVAQSPAPPAKQPPAPPQDPPPNHPEGELAGPESEAERERRRIDRERRRARS